MAKWADYCISAVRYAKERKHIESVKVREDKGDELGEAKVWTRSEVISSIEKGYTFITIYKGDNGKWRHGEDVHIITVNNKKYIRTDRNEIEEDNLGELPEF